MSEHTPYPWEGVPAGVPCWHIHHLALLEWSYWPLNTRAAVIAEYKPEREVETRLRLMRPVRGELPAEVVEAGRQVAEAVILYQKADDWVCGEGYRPHSTAARDARRKASTAWQDAEEAFVRIQATHADAINALHRAECPDCPWDGTTIFPEEKP